MSTGLRARYQRQREFRPAVPLLRSRFGRARLAPVIDLCPLSLASLARSM